MFLQELIDAIVDDVLENSFNKKERAMDEMRELPH